MDLLKKSLPSSTVFFYLVKPAIRIRKYYDHQMLVLMSCLITWTKDATCEVIERREKDRQRVRERVRERERES
jgi:hypothetical protein